MPDVSDIKIGLDLIRYEQKLMALDTLDLAASYKQLEKASPAMAETYFKHLVLLQNNNQDTFLNNLGLFLKDKRIQDLQKTVAEKYSPSTMDKIKASLLSSLQYYKHYFPGAIIPRFYTLISEYGYQSFIFEDYDKKDAIGIGLDLYLGDYNYKGIDPTNPVFSDYITRTYNQDHIVKKSMEILVDDQVGQPSGKRFIDQMVHHGKKLYILERLIPTAPDSVLFEYSAAQTEWVKNNELQIWDFFLSKNMIYETNHLIVTKYLSQAPTSQGMPPVAPGRTGVYIGYKIVSAFMDRNPQYTIYDLLLEKDAQKIMEEARYKPRRK